MKKDLFLLSKAEEFCLMDELKFEYNYKDQINFVKKDDNLVPAILVEMSGPTHSKTARRPGDDDPDDGRCY